MADYQLMVIGAGPGGYHAALEAAKLGVKTAVVEMDRAGGTCLNRGCVPTKALLHSSELYREAKESEEAGVSCGEVSFDLAKAYAHKDGIVETLATGVEGLLKNAGVQLIYGKATIPQAGQVEVALKEGGKACYTAENIIVATGAEPLCPPIPGADSSSVITSDELLASPDKLWESLVIIGGGVIGVEFATFYSDLGVKVTVVEGLDRLLPNMDREIGQNLAMQLKKRGVEVNTGAMVERIEEKDGVAEVFFKAKDEIKSACGEKVLMAIGRRPKFADIFTGDLAPEREGNRIKVGEHYETSLPGIYAIGDVSSKVQLAHVAQAQGAACVDMLYGKGSHLDCNIIPGCIYSTPEIACIGITEAEAKEAGIPVKVGKCVMGGNARTMISGVGRSFMKVVAEEETGRILGAQLMCPNATDMISQIGQAMANSLTAEDLLKAMRPHPTYEEALTDALENLVEKLSKK